MSQFAANENFSKHVSNMDYTAIQNMKANAIDAQDWEALDRADALEAQWLEAQ
jgi:hypothetical protein